MNISEIEREVDVLKVHIWISQNFVNLPLTANELCAILQRYEDNLRPKLINAHIENTLRIK